MFKKPLSNIKTSAPLRNSDRKRLKQNAVAAFGLTAEEGEALVPTGIQSAKFSTHLEEHGVLYLNSGGDPLWFTIGKGSDDLIPTIYTLWKKQDLLPFLLTPPAVIPILIGGADLMIPGVIHCPASLPEGQLVCVRQYKKDDTPLISAPLAIGRLALSSDQLRSAENEKGKAVLVCHTWKDSLFCMGSKIDPPADTSLVAGATEDTPVDVHADDEHAAPPPLSEAPSPSQDPEAPSVAYRPQEVTELLLRSLVQAVSKILKDLPPSKFPIPATIFYTNYILPFRPAFPPLVLPPESYEPSEPPKEPPVIETEITIKSSTHKSLTAFLKSVEKMGLIAIKPPHKQQPDLLITAVNASHPLVLEHSAFVTIKDIEATAAKKAAREGKQKEDQVAGTDVEITEHWKPHQATVGLFEAFGASTSDFYTPGQVRELVQSYVASHNLVNSRDQAYINLDASLSSCVASIEKSKGKDKNKTAEDSAPVEFLRRDELIGKVLGKMQSWYKIKAPGKDVVTKKGSLSPIHVVTKIRQGRKACTLVTGFEAFLVVDAHDMAEELRKVCAGATSVNPVPGKAVGSGMEVFVQGKQAKAVVEYLTSKGVPKKWITVSDLTGGKK